MTKIRFTLTAAAILAALTLCGCTDQKTDYNYDLIGGELNSENEYTVDIRKDDKDDTGTSSNTPDIITVDDTNSSDEQNPTTSDAPSAPTSEPTTDTSSSDADATTPSNAEVTHPVTSQPEASKVEEQTSEPTSNTATSETSKPSTSEKKDTTSNTAQKYDENGFPANPEPFQSFTDASGQRWEYDNFAGWCKAGGGGVEVTEIPRSSDIPYGQGEQILF